MGKKQKKATRYSINEKLANTTLKKIDSLMDELRSAVGKKGDGANGGSKTLIGAIEGCNRTAYDGKALMDAYSRFNDVTLVKFRDQIRSMDQEYNVVDKIAK